MMAEQPARSRSSLSREPQLDAIFPDKTWEALYRACCWDTGEAASLEGAQSFHDAMQALKPASAPDKLVLRCLRMGPTAVSCLAVQLKDRGYTHVDFSDNQLGDQSVQSVRSLMRVLPRVQYLALTGNLIGPAGARELGDELEGNRSLVSLVLGADAREAARVRGGRFRSNAIGADGVRALLEGLHRNGSHSLTTLSLCYASLGAAAGSHLANFLAHDRTLKHLNVSHNPLTSEGVCALLPECTRLRILCLADTGCRGELIHSHFCSMMKSTTTLAHLSLAHNPLEPRPLRSMARALSANSSLVSLDLACTSMNTETVTMLADAILVAPVQTITELDLSDNNLSHVEAATALAHAISKSVLQVLRLNRNPMGDLGVREIADALDPEVCSGGFLQQLDLCSCRIGTAGATYLFQRLARNTSLCSLRLRDNFIDGSLDVSIVEGMSFLAELNLSGNRLPHNLATRVAETCARNRRRARDEEPSALRAEVGRLLFEETKLVKARTRVAADEVDISERRSEIQQAREALAGLRAADGERQGRLERRIAEEEEVLAERRALLQGTMRELEETAQHYVELQQSLQQTLLGKQRRLHELRVQAGEIDLEDRQQSEEHPRAVDETTSSIRLTTEGAKDLQKNAREVQQKLAQLQEQCLTNLRP